MACGKRLQHVSLFEQRLKSKRYYHNVNMTNQETWRGMRFPCGPAEDISNQSTDHGQPSCSDENGSLITCVAADSAWGIAEATIDTVANTIHMTLSNFNAVAVGKSNTEQASKPVENHRQPSDEAQLRTRADSGEILKAWVDRPLPLIKIQGFLKGIQCEKILSRLESRQDNAKFEDHERDVTARMQSFADGKHPDMSLALKIEQAVAFSYQKEFTKSKSMFTSVIISVKNQTCQVTNPNILMARAYFLKVADPMERPRRLMAKFFEYLRRSEFLLQMHDSPEDWAELYQTYGCLWLDYMSLIPDNRCAHNTARDNAKLCFEKAITFSQQDPRYRVQIKRQMYAYIKLATILLQCCSNAARIQEKTIPSCDIERAKKHLDKVEFELGKYIPMGTWIQLLKTRSDQFYRQGSYNLAKETVEEAYRLASLHKFDTELNTLRGMMELFEKKLHSHLVFTEELELSSSEAACSASGSNSE